eukprot:Lithocolla_globosa_v1_NODE_361_length_4311_cov_58.582570.p3 type:complete len:104 gc:universal NODE_361_length_4311_cov_58.582570:3169-2858(-)
MLSKRKSQQKTSFPLAKNKESELGNPNWTDKKEEEEGDLIPMTHLSVRRSHKRQVLSSEPDASKVPVLFESKQLIANLCPFSEPDSCIFFWNFLVLSNRPIKS